LHGLRPERKRVGCFERTTERLERRHCPEIDRNLLSVALDRAPVHDLDVETR
jgi:hypothetical protein